MNTDRIWITAILVFCAAVFATLSLALISEAVREWWRRREVAKRMEPVLSGRLRKAQASGDVRELLRAERGVGGPLNWVPGLRNLDLFLEQSRLSWSPLTFLLLTAGLALALGATALVVTGSLLVFLLAAAFGASLPYLTASRRRKARFKQFEEEFPEAIELLTRAIRAGHPLSSGMQMVAEEGPPEVSMEFRRTFEEQRFGLPFDEALLGMVDRTDLVDVRIFAIAVMVQREVGGNLAEILENLAHTIRQRFYLRRQLRIYTAQGRLTGYALAALPVVVGFAIFLINPEYISLLFTEFAGRLMVIVALVLQVLGVLWIRKIINIDI